MAYRSYNVTLGTAAASIWPLDSTHPHTPIKWIRMETVTGNADVKVGDKNLTSTVYGGILEDGSSAAMVIGPFGGGECPLNLEDIYLLGTNAQVVHVMYVTL